jgi:hypothetical protein
MFVTRKKNQQKKPNKNNNVNKISQFIMNKPNHDSQSRLLLYMNYDPYRLTMTAKVGHCYVWTMTHTA